VPESDVLIELESTSTLDGARHCQSVMRQTKADSALLVTSAMHMPRALATFQECRPFRHPGTGRANNQISGARRRSLEVVAVGRRTCPLSRRHEEMDRQWHPRGGRTGVIREKAEEKSKLHPLSLMQPLREAERAVNELPGGA
jgi:hypothetical protein